jgi:DNA polymerase-4
VSDAQRLQEQLRLMSADVARSLQQQKLLAHTIRIKLRWSDFTTLTRQRSLDVGTAEEAVIFHHALTLWQDNWPRGRPVRLIGVGVSNLKQGEEKQLTFNF